MLPAALSRTQNIKRWQRRTGCPEERRKKDAKASIFTGKRQQFIVATEEGIVINLTWPAQRPKGSCEECSCGRQQVLHSIPTFSSSILIMPKTEQWPHSSDDMVGKYKIGV